MKRTILVVCLAFLPFILKAQKEGKGFIDSAREKLDGKELVTCFEKKLEWTKQDSNKIMLLDALCFFCSSFDPGLGIKYGLQALSLSQQMGYKKYLSNIYGNIGADYFQLSDFPKGLEYMFLSLKMDEESGRKEKIQLRLYNLSSAYFNIKEYSKALEYANRSLKICEELHDTLSIGLNFSNIGAIYSVELKSDEAFEYLFKALKIFEKVGDNPAIASTLSHISATYSDQKKFKEALDYASRALKINEDMGDKEGMCVNLSDIGNFYFGMATDSAGGMLIVHSEAYLAKAIEYYKRGEALCNETHQLEVLYEIEKTLSEAYELSGNYRDAIKSYKEYASIKDSLHSDNNKLKLARLETQREAELKEKQIEINKLAEIKKRDEHVLYTVAIVLLLAVILVVARNFMVQKKANKVKEELLLQKDLFMKEIHHRVKNNLQVISSLLDLQLLNIEDEHARNAMSESNTRVRSISLIHQQLYQSENINVIEFSKFAKELMYQVSSVFSNAGQKIVLKSTMPETKLDIDTAVPLGLILNELMTNSYKYAFGEPTEGFIEIALHHSQNYELIYKDSGPGLPVNAGGATGIGMKVIRSLCKQIGGDFVYMEQDKTFLVTFKDMAGRKTID